jgi:hypothetical protein
MSPRGNANSSDILVVPSEIKGNDSNARLFKQINNIVAYQTLRAAPSIAAGQNLDHLNNDTRRQILSHGGYMTKSSQTGLTPQDDCHY